MNSLPQKPVRTAIILIPLILLGQIILAQPPAMPLESKADDVVSDPEKEKTAKRAALAAAADLLMKKTRTFKRINRLKQDIAQRYSFEFKKDFTTGPVPPDATRPSQPAPGDKTISISGGLGEDLAPVIRFSSRFHPADIQARFDVLNHELSCEISNRSINRFTGGNTSLGLSSDGSDAEVRLDVRFPF